jgi:hypothetical protein
LAEVGAPNVIVGLSVYRAEALAPHDTVGRVDDAVVVVVAG